MNELVKYVAPTVVYTPDDADWETDCPASVDGIHCNCWYDGCKCCTCGDPALGEN